MVYISLALILVLVAADQIIKYIVTDVAALGIGEVVDFIKIGETSILSFTQQRNQGAAWSVLSGRTWFLIAITSLALAFAVYVIFRRKLRMKQEYIYLSMIVAGGLGNLIDRVRMLVDRSFYTLYNGEKITGVVDYLKFDLFEFPIFNFADICIVCGAILFCVVYIFFDKDQPEVTKADKNEQSYFACRMRQFGY